MTEKAVRVLRMIALRVEHLENFGHAFVLGLKSCSHCPLLPPPKGPATVQLDVQRDFWESFTASDDTYQVRHTPQRAKD